MLFHRAIGLSLAALAFATFACRGKDDRQPAQSSARVPSASAATEPVEAAAPDAGRQTFNVILIMVDSLRSDMPWNGYERDIAPRMDAFRKKRCVNYLKAYSISSYTAASVAPTLMGEFPSAMVRDGQFFQRYPADSSLLVSERVQKAGHRTLAGHAHGYFLPLFGLSQGFDDYKTLPGVDLSAVTSVTSKPLTELAIGLLSKPENTTLTGDRRFFAYFHYMDPHHTYESHDGYPKYGNKARDVYDHEVHYTDDWIGKLLDFAEKQPWWKDTVVIITADHGEGFGERKWFRHGGELWESLIKVPLLICPPGVAPRDVANVRRSAIDLAPTIADLMGVDANPAFRGASLVPEIWGAKTPEPKRIVADLPRLQSLDRRRAVIDGDWKIVAYGDDASFFLFDLANDPWEEKDLARTKTDDLERMKRVYREESAKIPTVDVLPGVVLKGAPAGRRW